MWSGQSGLFFKAVGAQSGEIMQFKAGVIVNGAKPHNDCLESSLGAVTLTSNWR